MLRSHQQRVADSGRCLKRHRTNLLPDSDKINGPQCFDAVGRATGRASGL